MTLIWSRTAYRASKAQSSCTPGRAKIVSTPCVTSERARAWPPVSCSEDVTSAERSGRGPLSPGEGLARFAPYVTSHVLRDVGRLRRNLGHGDFDGLGRSLFRRRRGGLARSEAL